MGIIEIGCIPFVTASAFSEMLLVDVGGQLGSYGVPSNFITWVRAHTW